MLLLIIAIFSALFWIIRSVWFSSATSGSDVSDSDTIPSEPFVSDDPGAGALWPPELSPSESVPDEEATPSYDAPTAAPLYDTYGL